VLSGADLEVVGRAEQLPRLVDVVLLAEWSALLRARSDVDVEHALVVALEVADGQRIVKVEHVAERLQEDVGRADESVLDRLPERIFLFGNERDVMVAV